MTLHELRDGPAERLDDVTAPASPAACWGALAAATLASSAAGVGAGRARSMPCACMWRAALAASSWWASSWCAVAASSAAAPRPRDHSPQSAWLSDATSPVFGWLVNSVSTSARSPSTSSAKPWRAFLGPTSTNTRAPAA